MFALPSQTHQNSVCQYQGRLNICEVINYMHVQPKQTGEPAALCVQTEASRSRVFRWINFYPFHLSVKAGRADKHSNMFNGNWFSVGQLP